MSRKVVKKSRPEYFWGGLLQAGIGSLFNVASGLVQTNAQAKAAKQMYNRQRELAINQAKLANDNNIASSINNMYQAENYNNNQDKYYEYSKGGTATQHPRRRGLTDTQYYSIMKQVAADNWRKWGDASPAAAFNRAINSNAYDYRGYYNKYPNSQANADTHWTDEFKGVGERTFSDQSKYSGVRHPKYNPNGIRGGHWYGASENMFVPNIQQLVERSKFARGGITNKRTSQPDALDKIGNWVNKNRKSNIIAQGLYSLGFDRGTIRRTKSDIKELVHRGILPNFNSDNGLLSAASPLGGPIRSASAIAKGIQAANKVRQVANASKAAQAVKQSAKVEGSNVMKYIQQRANPNSIYNTKEANNILRSSPYGELRKRLASRNRWTAIEDKAIATRYKNNPRELLHDALAGKLKTKGTVSKTVNKVVKAVKPTTKPIPKRKVVVKQNKPTTSNNGVVNQQNKKPVIESTQQAPTAQPKPATQSASTAQPTVSVTPSTPASSATQPKPINTSDILAIAHANGITRWGMLHPKANIAARIGIPSVLGAAAFIKGAYDRNQNNKNIAANKPANNSKVKVQPQQVKNDTVQVANQTPNDSTVVQNNTQADSTKVVNNQTLVANNGTVNQAASSIQTPTNNQRVATNKNKTRAAAQTIQRKGRTKSRVATNRTNNNSNNIRQNLNFEPINNVINDYSQVEDVQGRSYDEYKADIDAEAEARRQEVVDYWLKNYQYEDRNTTDEMRYGGKARSKRRVPIKITDGGVAQRIGNNTFLLRGGSHEQVNPSGQTGIGIKVGNNEIEAEGGEVAQRVGNALRIFSAQPMINGISPAQAVEAGANKNRIFAIQEALKRKGYRCGGRAKFVNGGDAYGNKNWWNRNGMSVNSSDWIGLGTDLAGSLALGALNANAYKNLKYDYKLPNYVDETPVAFDTTYHNDAQRATVERNRLNAQKIIANNTSSANTAVQRMQQSNADAMMETNKLWDEKANKEVELRNMASQNEQQVRARNAAARNQYYQNVAEIQNKRIDAENANRLARSNAWTTSLQGLQGAANNFLNSTRQRFEDENALMATIAAGDAATPYRMMAFGTQFGPRVINAIRAMNNIEGMKDPGAAPVRSNYSNDADYSTARAKWETAMKNYEYWKQRNQFLSHYDDRGRLIKRR